MRHRAAPRHARSALRWRTVLAGALALGSLSVVGLLDGSTDTTLAESWVVDCGTGTVLQRSPLLCAHPDEVPPGVDVAVRVPTQKLKRRPGAGPAAFRAAESLGVPTALATTATTPAVQCDGDGRSGYRVQPLYVVEAGRTNRFSSLESSFRLWAAGIDDVVNRSAALTGGVRRVRYVTVPGADGGCVADVLNVTVPAGSMTSFNATISAVRALGYDEPTRKYLMWTDANVLCGIASTYVTDAPGQSNLNNGTYPQYARIDNGCWGLGNGTTQLSVESHELLHTLGAVQNTAPHSTQAGHCWDESDTLCYADGGNHAMVQVCPPEREYLLDCRADDYFSTYPEPGSYLDVAWNSASSRFLVGGGDGTGGGTAGAPSTLGARISVNNPAVPGLPTQATVAPVLPTGRSVASVQWTSARKDCTFTDPTAEQSQVTCAATASSSTTVTATVVDSTGARKVVTSPLTFVTGTARPVDLGVVVDHQPGSTASVCTGVAFPAAITVRDRASGLPVKGLSATLTRRALTATAASTSGSALTAGTGVAQTTGTLTAVSDISARTLLGKVYAAGTASSVRVVPGACTPTLTGRASRSTVYYGEPVTVAGALVRDVAGSAVPVAGGTVTVQQTAVVNGVTRKSALGTATTGTDGAYALDVKPTATGTLTVLLTATPGYAGAQLGLGPVTVHVPTTELTASVANGDVGHGEQLRVTGRLTRTSGALTAGAVTTGLSGLSVGLKVVLPGGTAVSVGTARTSTDGSFVATPALRASGTLVATYAGAAGLPAATVDLGTVTAGTWSPTITLLRTRTTTGTVLEGTVRKTYAGTTKPANAVPVTIVHTPASTGRPTTVLTVSTSASGGYRVTLPVRTVGSYQVVLGATTGYAGAVSPTVQAP